MIENITQEKYHKKTIPDAWLVVRFGDVFEILKSGNNPRSDLNNEGNYKYIHYGDIHKKWKGFLDCKKESIPRIAEDKVSNLPHLQDGDLIIADASEDYAGLGIATEILNVGNQKIVAGLHTILARGNKDIIADGYKGYIQESKDFKNKLINISTGTTVYGISKTKLADIQIIIPPINEQRAIAEVLSDVDALIEAQEALIEKKRLIKQGVMQELLTGKRLLPGFSEEWHHVKLRDIGSTFGGLSGKSKSDFENGNTPYIPFLNILENPIIKLDQFDYVNVKSSESQNKAQCGDLFFNGSSETPEEVGMCSVLLAEVPNLCLNSFCFGFRLFDNVNYDPLFLSYLFRSEVGRGLLYSLAQGATRYNLSKTKFLELEITVPEYKEQQEIAKIINDIDLELNLLEKKKDKIRKIKQGMLQELLTGRTRLV